MSVGMANLAASQALFIAYIANSSHKNTSLIPPAVKQYYFNTQDYY
jgi:hypothetical protein